MTEGVDYSFSRPGGAALQRAGKKFAIRYVPYRISLNPDRWTGKGLSRAELADLRAHGLSVGMVFETTARRPLDGRSAGVYDAQLTQQGLAYAGLPASMPVYFAVDFDAYTPYHMQRIDEYLRGAASILGPNQIGVYGGYKVIEHVGNAGTARFFWQTYAWSYGRVSRFTHLYQYDNGEKINGQYVDFCKAFAADYGQFPRRNVGSGAPAPSIPDTSTEEESDLYETWVPRIQPRPGTLTMPAGSRTYHHPYMLIEHYIDEVEPATVLRIFGVVWMPKEYRGSHRWYIGTRNAGGLFTVPEGMEGVRFRNA